MEPGIVTYMSILKAMDSPAALEQGKQVHAHLTEAGCQSDVRVGTPWSTCMQSVGA